MKLLREYFRRFSLSPNLILFGILFLGALLRLTYLSKVPSGLHYDEAQSGYNAFLISQHLKNIHGEFLPTDIDYFQDFRPAGNSYFTAISVRAFGLNEFSTRLPAAILGTITIYLTYLLAFKIFSNKKIGYLAAFLLSISPYQIVFSRASSDGIFDSFCVLLSLIFILNFLEKGRKIWLPLIYIFLFFSFFIYQTSRFMAPVLIILLLFSHYLFERAKSYRYKLVLLILIIYLIFPLGFNLVQGKANARFNQVSTFSYPEVQRALNESITESGTLGIKPLIVRAIHNKPLAYLQDISKRYLSFFEPSTVLFDTTRPIRYRLPMMGMFTLAEYVGLLLGIYTMFRYQSKRLKWFILGALLLSPIPSAITFEDFPNFQRALYLIPFWQIIAAYGIYSFIITASKKIKVTTSIFLIAIIIFQFIVFIYQYFLISPIHEPFYRNYERKELALFLASDEVKKYNKIGLSEHDGTYIFYLFFNKLDISNVKVKKKTKYFQGDFTLSNLNFINKNCLDLNDFLLGQYDLTIQLESCKSFSFNKPSHYFRRKNNSLALIAYETDKKLFEEFKIKNEKLLNCRQSIFNNYLIQSVEDLEKMNDKDAKSNINNKLLDCAKTYQ